MKQLHRSSCIKIQERLLFLIFFILKKKRLYVFWGVWGSWTNVTLDLGWWCFLHLPVSAVKPALWFLSGLLPHSHLPVPWEVFQKWDQSSASLAHRLCSIKTPHCRSSAREETGHAHLSLCRWPADQREAVATSLEYACFSSRWFSWRSVLKQRAKVAVTNDAVCRNYDQFQASEHLPQDRVLSLWLLLHEIKSNPATMVWTCLGALDHMSTCTWHPMPAFSCGAHNFGSSPYASHRGTRWTRIFCHVIMSSWSWYGD